MKETIIVRYHSQRWEMLVASGYSTAYVDSHNRAHMTRTLKGA